MNLNARQKRTLKRSLDREIREVAESVCGLNPRFNRWINDYITYVVDATSVKAVQRPSGRNGRVGLMPMI